MARPFESVGIMESARDLRPARGGFTVIELFFVMTIIATLIALLLPAIQSAREVARRTQCQKNLMQIGLALGNYVSTHKVFPPGVVNLKGPISNVPDGYHYGWAVQILPYLEQPAMYREFDFKESVYADRNLTAREHRMQVFLCPSDGFYGLTSYAACHHDVEAPIDVDNHGVFFLNSHVSYADIKDGPAFTILVGEYIHEVPTLGWAVGTTSSLRNTGWPINTPDPAGGTLPTTATTWIAKPSTFVDYEAFMKNGQLSPSRVGGFSSRHSGTANFLFGDGSVHLLSEKIDEHVYRSLGHRSDGNLISADDY
jgi:prepilin-type processing-associated H-X9-DG protein